MVSDVPAAAPPSFVLERARVAPAAALFGGRRLAIGLRFRAPAPLDLKVHVRTPGGKVMRRWRIRSAAPGWCGRPWDGLTTRGRVAPDARYRVVVGPVGGRLRRAGSFAWHGHVYPVRGPHWFRGQVGLFGVPRNGGRTHEGFDINAACGTPVVAARAGVVKVRRYDPVLYGNLVIVRGLRERRDYWYAHLAAPLAHAPARACARAGAWWRGRHGQRALGGLSSALRDPRAGRPLRSPAGALAVGPLELMKVVSIDTERGEARVQIHPAPKPRARSCSATGRVEESTRQISWRPARSHRRA